MIAPDPSDRPAAPAEDESQAGAPEADPYARLDGKVASLTAALLARKGQAAPSLKRFARDSAAEVAADGKACAGPKDGACAKASRAERRVNLTLRLPVPDFLRLKLAAGLFERTSQSILLEALRAHLDREGVERFDDCACLKKAVDGLEGRSPR